MEETKPMTAVEELKALEQEVSEQRASLKIRAAKSKGPVNLPLIEPITVHGAEQPNLMVRPHTVRDMKLADEDRDGWTMRLAGMLTGLAPEEVELLGMADWNSLQAVVEGFQLRRGAGSPAR